MSWMTVALAVAAAATAVSARGAYVQGKTNAKIAQNNATVAEYQAQDAQRRGEEEAQRANRQARQLAGAQRAMMSARGLDISEGTPAELLDQTDFFGMEDARIARANAAKEAWALRARKSGFQGEASAARSAGNWGAASTLLDGASRSAFSYGSANRPPKA